MTEPKRRDYVQHDEHGRGIVLDVFGREPNRFADIDWDDREPRGAALVNTLHPVGDEDERAAPQGRQYTPAERAHARYVYDRDLLAGHVTRSWRTCSPEIRTRYLEAALVDLAAER